MLVVLEFDDNNYLQINEFVKRARAAKIHAFIISHLKKVKQRPNNDLSIIWEMSSERFSSLFSMYSGIFDLF